MSQALYIDGIELVPSKVAGKTVGLSNDYVSRLAREQRIFATQIKRQWYVDLQSLRRYIESTKIEKEERNRELSQQRQIEKLQKTARVIHETQKRKVASQRMRRLAVVDTSAILVLGILTTGLGWLWWNANPAALPETPAVATVKTAKTELAQHDTSTGGTEPALRDTSEISGQPSEQGFVAIPVTNSATTTSVIAARFSDDAVVIQLDGQALIQPTFTEREGDLYEFVNVERASSGAAWRIVTDEQTLYE